MSRCLLTWLLLCGVQGSEFAWTDVAQTNAPTERLGAGMVITSQNRLWMWGGGSSSSLTTDLYYVDIQAASKEWQSHTPSGNAPAMRSYLHMMIASDDVMYMYGGDHDDIWSMDLQAATPTWTEISTSGTPHATKSWNTAVLTTGKVMWVFGGYYPNNNKVTYIDLTASSPQWTSVSPTGDLPENRRHHAAVITSTDVMYIFGGQDSGHKNDLWYLDTKDPTQWVEVSPSGTLPGVRRGCKAAITSADVMWIVAGEQDTGFYSDVWYIDLRAGSPQWTEAASVPAKRAHHSLAITSDDKLWVFGGYHSGYHNTLWNMDVKVTTTTATATSSTTGTATASSTTSQTISSTTSTASSTSSSTATISTTWSSTTTGSLTSTSTSSSSTFTSSSSSSSTSFSSTSTSRTSTTSTTTASTTSSSSSSTTTSSTTSSSTTTRSTTSTSTTTSSTSTSSATTSSSTTRSTTSTSTTTSSTSTSSATTSSSTTSSSTTRSTSTSSSSSSTSTSSSTTTVSFSSTTSTSSSSSSTTSTSSTASSTVTSSTSVTTSSISTSSTSSSSPTSTTTSSSTTTSESRTSTTTRTTSSTTLTGEDLAKHIQDLQRQEEAAQAVAAVEAIEEETVQELLQAIFTDGAADPVETGGILANVTRQTENGTVKVTAVAPQAVRRDGVVEITSGETTKVRVPAAVVAQAADRRPAQAGDPPGNASRMLLICVTDLAEQKASKIVDRREEGEATSVVKTQSLSITLRNEDGKVVELGQLLRPIEFVLESEDVTNTSCAFWDEEHSSWSFRGLETLKDPAPGQLMCRTQHLSIFSGVLTDIWQSAVSVIECSSIWGLFTQEGVERLAAGRWISSLPAISTLLFVASFFVVLMRAAYVDRKTQQAVPWQMVEPVLFREKPHVSGEDSDSDAEGDDEPQLKHNCCVRQLITVKEWCFWCTGICFGVENIVQIVTELLPNAPEATVNRCIKTLHAHRSGVAKDSLAILLPAGEKFDADDTFEEEEGRQVQVARSQNRQSVFASLAGAALPSMNNFTSALRDLSARWNVHIHGAGAVKSILDRSWCGRVGLLLPAFHPWIALLRLSIVTSYKVRVSLIFLKICTSGATNALFFSSNSPLEGSDPKCWTPKDYFRRLVTNTIVGFLAAFLGDCVVFTLFLLQVRKPIEKRQWSERAISRQIATWRCKGFCFWFIWLFYSGTCVFYVMIFLANVRLVDAHDWYQSTGMSLLQDLFVLPLTTAVAMGSLATLALRSRGVRAKVESRWFEDDNVQEEPQEEPELEPGAVIVDTGAVPVSPGSPSPNSVKADGRPTKAPDFDDVLPGMPMESS